MGTPRLIRRVNFGFGSALVLAIPSACATTLAVDSSLEDSRATHVIVENHSPSEIQVYVVQSGARFSLGRVAASHSARLVLPSGLRAGWVALLGESRPRVEKTRFRTEPLTVLPGQTVRWRLEATGGRSFVSITGSD